jgi:signal transduction histidine kinase
MRKINQLQNIAPYVLPFLFTTAAFFLTLALVHNNTLWPDNMPGEVRISVSKIDGNLRLFVRDNGIGMPPGVNLERGNTLGLKLIRSLVNQVKGKVSLEGNQGTHYQIEFPLN